MKYLLIALFLTLLPLASVFAEPAPWANYTVTLDATWSAETHPGAPFPNSPHFSPLIGGTHNSAVSFWALDELASQGFQEVAEWGNGSTFRAEIDAEINTGNAGAVVRADGISLSPGSTSTTFSITPDHPLISLITMVAPSPDWVIGVSNLSLLDSEQWVDELTIEIYPIDAGTDSGVDYVSPNQPTIPHQLIALLEGYPFTAGVPLGTITFRLDGAAPVPLPVALLALTARPNPFNPSTVLHYELPAGAQTARLAVYDPRGHLVRRLDTALGAGAHTTRWDGRADSGDRAATGVYFARLDVDGVVAVQKVALVK